MLVIYDFRKEIRQKKKTFITETEPKSIENINGNIYVLTEAEVYRVVDQSLVKIFFVARLAQDLLCWCFVFVLVFCTCDRI